MDIDCYMKTIDLTIELISKLLKEIWRTTFSQCDVVITIQCLGQKTETANCKMYEPLVGKLGVI